MRDRTRPPRPSAARVAIVGVLSAVALLATAISAPAAAAESAAPVTGENVALASAGGVATASGSEGDGSFGWTPDKVIDGVTSGPAGTGTSRWSSNYSDSAWITVELAEPTVIDHVNIYWEAACAAQYRLQVSTDGASWTDATGVVRPACGALDTQAIGAAADPSAAYSHVRMQTIERTPIGGNKYGVSMWEFEVWNGAEPEPVRELPLVPKPAVVETTDAEPFTITPKTRVIALGAAIAPAEFFADVLRPSTGFDVPVKDDGPAERAIRITVDADADYTVDGAAPTEESYVLDVAASGINLTATTAHGAFNGVQTLRQLLPVWAESDVAVNADWEVPAVHIEDAPRFSYRGVMLDVARSFQTVAEVKQHIDALAQLKLSVLHMHLADDQGWRIEITNEGRAEGDTIDYSKLTSASGITAMNSGGYRNEVGRTGFYTQDDYREIVEYANERFITIVPEVDVPSHTNAALHALPELNTARSLPAADPETGVVPWNGTGSVGYSALDEQHDASYAFVSHVFTQLAELTGGPYVHIGGDEAHAMGHSRFVDFITRAVPEVKEATGAGVMGWSEFAEAGLDQPEGFWDGSVVQYWIGSGDWVRNFIAKGGKAVISAATGSYLDQKYNSATPIGLSWACGGSCDFDRYYGWDPTTTVAGGVAEAGVLGVEGPLWSETVRGADQAQYLVLPRAASILETGWTPKADKDIESFRQRLGDFGARFAVQGHNFYESPNTTWAFGVASADVAPRTGAEAEWPVGYVSAPGTKLSQDGTQILADTVSTDGDPASKSALAEPLTAELVCGTDRYPVVFSTSRARDILHGAGVYTATVTGAFHGDIDCELTTSTGHEGAVRVDVGPKHPLPADAPALGEPTLAVGDGGVVRAGDWVSLALDGFSPDGHVEILIDGAMAFTVRQPVGGFEGYAPIPAATFDGEREFTARQGDRTISLVVEVESDVRDLANRIDQSQLTIADVSSEETVGENAPATNAIDGDPNTFWHTKWQGSAPAYPHHITIDLGASYDVTGLQYLTRQNAANGRIKDYQVYVSLDGATWGDPVATGSFTSALIAQTVDIDAVAGRYVKLVGLNSIPGNAFAGAAEINIGGVPR
ncbi:family 20 glycosylhydrolase [Agromyces neolithicus]|uniref:beta-N-acetylhexosaminidase n=1 Tax=Agromyces neolithicus TaxID=269420 RepID=A0ABP4YGP1_9MICO